jgi:predicted MPP superfamily phosphohydrolase
MPLSLSRRQLIAGMAGAAAAGAPAAARAENRAEHFEVTDTELRLAELDPAHEGLRIAQLSDLHVGNGTPDGRLIAAVRRVNEEKPDLVLLTGDFVTHSAASIAHIPIVLEGLKAPAFAVLGNHDHYVDARAVRKSVEKMGYEVLQNEHTVTRVRGAPLCILGVDDGQTRHDHVGNTFKGAPEGGTRLVMLHTPPTANKLPEGLGVAVFAGHTHGGQIHVPGLTEALFRRVGQPYVRGRYDVRGNHLYVNRGLGFGSGSALPRVGSDPEVSFFTLRHA